MVKFLTTYQSNDILKLKSTVPITVLRLDLILASDDPDKEYLKTLRKFTYLLFWIHGGLLRGLKENLNASRPSEHPTQGGEILKRLGGIIGCKDKTSSCHLNGFPSGDKSGSTV